MLKKTLQWTLAATLIWAGAATPVKADAARDYVSIVGSSTVYPFSTVVAEQFTNASRQIKASEYESCTKNGVNEIVEVKIGYDGIVVANSKKAPLAKLTRKELFLALAKQVPDPAGAQKVVPNPYKTWKEIDPALPATKIEVLGPPPTSGTRDAFVELVMEHGAESYDWIKALKKSDEKQFKAIAQTVREDGAYIEAGENDNLIVQKLEANPNAMGIFGFSFLDQNADKIQGALMENVAPAFEAIAGGSYPVSRPLFFYVKKAHVGKIPGIREFLKEFSADKAWGPEGYLADKGLIPMPDGERKQFRVDVEQLKTLSRDQLK
ncbi:MAG: substrate-binding domain-containing protein [Desulfatitalea sp.]|nr:substrate-binding domain-containing protein [Desulfatitalea sp.]